MQQNEQNNQIFSFNEIDKFGLVFYPMWIFNNIEFFFDNLIKCEPNKPLLPVITSFLNTFSKHFTNLIISFFSSNLFLIL